LFSVLFFVLSFSGLNPTGRHTIKVKAKRKSMGPDRPPYDRLFMFHQVTF
jgi:hypothetical protein